MSFNFGFEMEMEDGEQQQLDGGVLQEATRPETDSTGTLAQASAPSSVPSRTHTLTSLLDSLPDKISYSSISVAPLDGNDKTRESILLPRRDLFDARFQILSEDDADNEGSSDAGNVDSQSDLVPGVYEGGLKTWECSLDLVGVLRERYELKERRVVELGCGTALPSCYVLLDLLRRSDRAHSPPTHLHLCDFNEKVLQLVTLPNLLLAYALSSATGPFPSVGDLELSPEFLDGFQNALIQHGIELTFHSGPWDGLQFSDTPQVDTLVLTSETTYSLSGIQSLLGILKTLTAADATATTTTLVATKDYYFGLGGGVVAFLDALEADRRRARDVVKWDQQVDTLCQWEKGVRRRVLCLRSNRA